MSPRSIEPRLYHALQGKADPAVVAELQHLRRDLFSLQSTVDADRANAPAVFATPDMIPPADTTSEDLQAGGQAPLNVTGLIGRLAEPQIASAPTVTVLPAFDDPITQDGALVGLSGSSTSTPQLYRFNGVKFNPGWEALSAIGILLTGTHAVRLSTYPATAQPLGAGFFETDRYALYLAPDERVRVW